MDLFGSSPALFARNAGQWTPEVHYGFQGEGASIAFKDDGLAFVAYDQPSERDLVDPVVRAANFSVSFDGANLVSPVGVARAQTLFNYQLGDSADQWVSSVPTFETVVYTNLYDKVSLKVSGLGNNLKYEFVVGSFADFSQIVVSYDGVNGLSIDEAGALHIQTDVGELVDDAPFIYQMVDGEQVAVSGGFKLLDANTYTFEITGDYSPGRRLIIDPTLGWGTYIGGGDMTEAFDVVADPGGDSYVVGQSTSPNWVTGSIDGVNEGVYDGFVAKYDATGTALWSTFLGGAGDDRAFSVDLDTVSAEIYVAGRTSSAGWLFGGYDPTHNGATDGFVANIDAITGLLNNGTFLGGASDDIVHDVTVDLGTGDYFVAGQTTSPTWLGGGVYGGSNDAFAMRFDTTDALMWGNYVGTVGQDIGYGIATDGPTAYLVGQTTGGPGAPGVDAFLQRIDVTTGAMPAPMEFVAGAGFDDARNVAVDFAGGVYLAGSTSSPGLGFGAVHDTVFGGVMDAYVARFGAGLGPTGPTWLSYLGGAAWDSGRDIVFDSGPGNLVVIGDTLSPGWLGSFGWANGAYDLSPNGNFDAFVFSISTTGTAAWSTYLGGPGVDRGWGVYADGTGRVYAVGSTNADSWVSGGANTTFTGGTMGYLVTLDQILPGWHVFSTFIGGDGEDGANDVATDSLGNVIVTGSTESAAWVFGGADTVFNGDVDAFVMKFDPTGAHLWSTFLGGAYADTGNSVAVNLAQDSIFVAGQTFSAGWVSGGYDTTFDGASEAFLLKLSKNGVHKWSTFLGGANLDAAYGVTADNPNNNIYVVGETASPNWTAFGDDTTYNGGGSDAFLARFARGGAFYWSTYIGGNKVDRAFGVAADDRYNVYVVGDTKSAGWVAGGYDTTYSDKLDGFLARYRANGNFKWSTYLGDVRNDTAYDVTVDARRKILVTGQTKSDFWVTGGFDTTRNGGIDAFVSKFNKNGTHVWSTYVGGSGDDRGFGIVTDSARRVFITGETDAGGWAFGGPDTTFNGGTDGFVFALRRNSTPLWGTYLGGAGDDSGTGIAVDAADQLFAVGQTESPGWLSGGFDDTLTGLSDGYLVQIV